MGGMSTQTGTFPLRVPFDSLTLAAVVAELTPLLTGGQIQDVRQPEPHELLLAIRSQGRSLTLLLSADARFARVHLTTERKQNAATPSAFCIALRRHIENGRIVAVRQRGFDRIFEIEVQNSGEDGTPTVNTLVAELMGKHSNLILIDAHGTVLEAAKRISHRINRLRETLPGKPYVAPPAPTGKHSPLAPIEATTALLRSLPLEGETAESVARTLQEGIAGMSPFLAREIAFRAFRSGLPQSEDLVTAWSDTIGTVLAGLHRPCLLSQDSDRGAYPIDVQHLPVDQIGGEADMNALLDKAFHEQIDTAARTSALQELLSRLERESKKLDKQAADVERTLGEGRRAGDYRQQGELLLAHLWKIEAGTSETTLQDFYSPEQSDRTIVLDPKLNPQENAQAYFRRAHKAEDAQAQAHIQQTNLQIRKTKLAAALRQVLLNQAKPGFSAPDVLLFQEALIAEGTLREERSALSAQPTGPDFQGHKIRRYTTSEGYEIYCGETATANDFLTTRVASPNDLWLHVRASPGSHVVIRTQGKPDKVPPSVLHRAALIAALHSNQKHSGLVPVDYTLKKHVRKPRGAAPGSVDVQREKTLHVAPHAENEKS